jgi:hypothetical protein
MFTTERRDRRVRRQAGLVLESLDDRLVLSAGATAEAVRRYQPPNFAHLYHHSHRREVLAHRSPPALPPNVSAALRALYREYEDQGGRRFTPSPLGGSPLLIRGSSVAVQIKVAFPPALGAYLPDLREDGMQIIRTVPAYGLAEGMLPISNLPIVAQIAAHVSPLPRLP